MKPCQKQSALPLYIKIMLCALVKGGEQKEPRELILEVQMTAARGLHLQKKHGHDHFTHDYDLDYDQCWIVGSCQTCNVNKKSKKYRSKSRIKTYKDDNAEPAERAEHKHQTLHPR